LPPPLLRGLGLDEGRLDAMCQEGLLEPAGGGYALSGPAAQLLRELRRPGRGADGRPDWGRKAGELCLGGWLVKGVPASATGQRPLLDAFADRGWPAEMANPLGRGPGARRQLRDAARNLGRGQELLLLEFYVRRGRACWRGFLPLNGETTVF
jgi:hypothetical protein